MITTRLLAPLALALPAIVSGLSGRTFTSWDCGLVEVCNVDNNPIADSRRIASGCDNGAAYMCDSYLPIPVSEDFSYGFAVAPGYNCCKCYELFWLNGYAAGKRMVVQVVNWMPDEEEGTDAGRPGDFAILTPEVAPVRTRRGVFGSMDLRVSYESWRSHVSVFVCYRGEDYGGVSSMSDCEQLPENLQGGCYWRWNWAGGEITGWDVEYKEVECPARLTAVSSCTPPAF
ncbi:unnamed protein product [Parascedosporium putredinis]|uniref:cellulase n=1 Tax=Parascedosporium putredinis TaxID=1442378 RepID=A0A9P1H719_9PEZI|nr:unnamed protein product [Parascedosporium putredinis]CAI8000990.1 unnamed protein product [Parascedosporium putredinis]